MGGSQQYGPRQHGSLQHDPVGSQPGLTEIPVGPVGPQFGPSNVNANMQRGARQNCNNQAQQAPLVMYHNTAGRRQFGPGPAPHFRPANPSTAGVGHPLPPYSSASAPTSPPHYQQQPRRPSVPRSQSYPQVSTQSHEGNLQGPQGDPTQQSWRTFCTICHSNSHVAQQCLQWCKNCLVYGHVTNQCPHSHPANQFAAEQPPHPLQPLQSLVSTVGNNPRPAPVGSQRRGQVNMRITCSHCYKPGHTSWQCQAYKRKLIEDIFLRASIPLNGNLYNLLPDDFRMKSELIRLSQIYDFLTTTRTLSEVEDIYPYVRYCDYCKEYGHLKKDCEACLTAMQEQYCALCQAFTHGYENCPRKPRKRQVCLRCGESGHPSRMCMKQRNPTVAICSHCGEPGHDNFYSCPAKETYAGMRDPRELPIKTCPLCAFQGHGIDHCPLRQDQALLWTLIKMENRPQHLQSDSKVISTQGTYHPPSVYQQQNPQLATQRQQPSSDNQPVNNVTNINVQSEPQVLPNGSHFLCSYCGKRGHLAMECSLQKSQLKARAENFNNSTKAHDLNVVGSPTEKVPPPHPCPNPESLLRRAGGDPETFLKMAGIANRQNGSLVFSSDSDVQGVLVIPDQTVSVNDEFSSSDENEGSDSEPEENAGNKENESNSPRESLTTAEAALVLESMSAGKRKIESMSAAKMRVNNDTGETNRAGTINHNAAPNTSSRQGSEIRSKNGIIDPSSIPSVYVPPKRKREEEDVPNKKHQKNDEGTSRKKNENAASKLNKNKQDAEREVPPSDIQQKHKREPPSQTKPVQQPEKKHQLCVKCPHQPGCSPICALAEAKPQLEESRSMIKSIMKEILAESKPEARKMNEVHDHTLNRPDMTVAEAKHIPNTNKMGVKVRWQDEEKYQFIDRPESKLEAPGYSCYKCGRNDHLPYYCPNSEPKRPPPRSRSPSPVSNVNAKSPDPVLQQILQNQLDLQKETTRLQFVQNKAITDWFNKPLDHQLKYLRIKELPTFDGVKCSDPSVQNFDQWLRIIDDTAEDIQESPIDLIKQKARGQIAKDLKTIPTSASWHAIKAKLIKDFSVIPTIGHAIKDMTIEQQDSDEKLFEYIERISNYAKRIGGLTDANICDDQTIIFYFISNLHNKTVRNKLSCRQFATLGEAFEFARNTERKMKNSDAVSQYLMYSPTVKVSSVDVNTNGKYRDRKRFTSYYHRERSSSPPQRNNRSYNTSIRAVQQVHDKEIYIPNDKNPQCIGVFNIMGDLQYIKCYQCGEKGHLAKNCINRGYKGRSNYDRDYSYRRRYRSKDKDREDQDDWDDNFKPLPLKGEREGEEGEDTNKDIFLPATKNPILTQTFTTSTDIPKDQWNQAWSHLLKDSSFVDRVAKNLAARTTKITKSSQALNRKFGKKQHHSKTKAVKFAKVVPDARQDNDNDGDAADDTEQSSTVAQLTALIRENSELDDMDLLKAIMEAQKGPREESDSSEPSISSEEEDSKSDE